MIEVRVNVASVPGSLGWVGGEPGTLARVNDI